MQLYSSGRRLWSQTPLFKTTLYSSFTSQCETAGYFKQHVGAFPAMFVAIKSYIFHPKHDLRLTLSKLFLCLDLTAELSQRNIKLNNEPEKTESCHIKKCKLSPWCFAEIYIANIYSGDWSIGFNCHSLCSLVRVEACQTPSETWLSNPQLYNHPYVCIFVQMCVCADRSQISGWLSMCGAAQRRGVWHAAYVNSIIN